jgi:hypothetical protein
MGTSWLPLNDAGLLAFVQPFSTKIAATPTAFGLTAADATTLTGLVTGYQTALATATDPSTRTPVSVTAKEVAKASLVAETRSLAKRVQANPAVTPEQKTDLGLPIHKTTNTPIPAPVTKPVLTVAAISAGRSVTIKLADESSTNKRAKPYGVDGAEVYSYVPADGEAPPTDLERWRFEGIATRSTFDILYNGEDVNKTSYICAAWFNPRGESGPASDKVTATIAA